MKKINGIFVLGGQRTGTTFLANLLVSQNKILGVTHPKHWGIYESSFFSIIENRFGDLKNKINYLSFISVMSKYDYFRLMGFDFNKLKNLNVDSYKDFFLKTHKIYAKKFKSKYWLEKTPDHIFFLERLLKFYPDAKFIMIKRNLFDSLESAYNLKYKNRQSLIQNIIYISRFTIVTYIYNKIIDKNINKVLIIDYNKIVEADKYEINKLEKYLKQKIIFKKNKFKMNSSYLNKKKIKVHKNYKILIKIIKFLLIFIPVNLLKFYKINLIKRRNLPLYFFSLIDEKIKLPLN